MLKLYNESAIHKYVPCANAEILYRRIKPARYAAMLRECAGDDRNPDKVNYETLLQRVLEWAIYDWSGIGFDEEHGDVPVSPEAIELLPETVKANLFKLVLESITSERPTGKKGEPAADPLDNSASTSSSVSTSDGTTAESAPEAT